MGKGGVGKTTLACATAITRARAGHRVLLASLDQAHSLGDALGLPIPRDPAPTAVLPGLDVLEIDSLALVEDRFAAVAPLLSGVGREHGVDLAALDPAELTGLPGVQELLLLVEIGRFAGTGDWDAIVLDCPPTADLLRILSAPATLLGYLDRIWPTSARMPGLSGGDLRRTLVALAVDRIAAEVAAARDLLADRTRTAAVLVTAAERVALAESARVRSAAALLGLRLDRVVVNKVLPPQPPVPADAHPAAHWYDRQRGAQLRAVDELRGRFPGIPVAITEYGDAEPVGIEGLAGLVPAPSGGTTGQGDGRDPMLGGDVNSGRARAGEPLVGLESGAGLGSVFTLRMQVPVADPATLRLGRVEDDLIVGADGVRRRMRLAPVLRRCVVDAAELDGDQLIVRFRPDPEVWPDE
ncbi:ArsA family ATPase [Nocardia sp. alder85J]|uniref:ArsA family ATPase n=1 Tax=Nocardia sp. alder85J TaxID=2862949 RepID=UPI002B1CCC5C|nr:TRC40/GET3/ArsA family transport-energizing ATPase [Nocardia sp. alder85J]